MLRPPGRLLARIFIGRDFSFDPENTSHAEFWTPRYPSAAIVSLMDLTNYSRAISLTDLAVPTLGTFTARVIFHGDRYAGTWQHGNVGGHMFGRIEKGNAQRER